MTARARDAGLALLREHALIAGQPVLANGKGIAVDDPATGEVIGWIPDLGASETERAIVAVMGIIGWTRPPPLSLPETRLKRSSAPP